jgi:murein DD-endopeptidase MepM/ murein hydrolase activator NlpD
MTKHGLKYPSEKSKIGVRSIQFLAASLIILLGLGLCGFLGDMSGYFGSAARCAYSPPLPPENSNYCEVSQQSNHTVDTVSSDRPREISDITGEGDTLSSLLEINVSNQTLAREVAAKLATTIQRELGASFKPSHELLPGKRYSLKFNDKGEFSKFTLELDPSNVFHCVKEGDRIKAWKEDVVLDFKKEALSFRVRRGIVQSVLAAHEGRELALKLVHMFRWDIDFRTDPRNGDHCKIVFERRYADDRPAGYGRILFATYDGKRTGRKTACLFNGKYYDEHGVELKKNFLKTPLNVLRITSGYGYRIHPVLGGWRMHWGVDYGAPIGTPVFSIANGTVIRTACCHDYGLLVCVKHDNGYESRYSHLSKILVKPGQKVMQGQKVGLVGSTGWSTGPHLFFQIIIKGKRVDPTKVKMVTRPKSVPGPLKPRFYSIVNARERLLMEDLASVTFRTSG